MNDESKPRLLDLFCGAGGAAWGYHHAGFEVIGVDIADQPDYPFECYQGDAVEILRLMLTGSVDHPRWPYRRLVEFDAIHASPPCQAFTSMQTMWNAREHADLLTPTRKLLLQTALPFVLENVPGAPMQNHITLCGTSFGLGTGEYELRRHRHFETSFPVMALPCQHRKPTIGIYGDHARDRRRVEGHTDRGRDIATHEASRVALGKEAMGMPWITRWKSASEAIPPAYTEHIGHYLLAEVNRQEPIAA